MPASAAAEYATPTPPPVPLDAANQNPNRLLYLVDTNSPRSTVHHGFGRHQNAVQSQIIADRTMLSLKQANLPKLSYTRRTLTDLPSEILDLILGHIYTTSGNAVSSIFPVSLTCRALRYASCPILFEILTVVANGNVIKKRSWASLQHLLARPHLLKHVRCLEIRAGIELVGLVDNVALDSAQLGQNLGRKVLFQCLTHMTGLRFLKLYYISEFVLNVIERLQSVSALQVSVDLRRIGDSKYGLHEENSVRFSRLLSSPHAWYCNFSLAQSDESESGEHVCRVLTSTKVRAVDWSHNYNAILALASASHTFPYLEELHISTKIVDAQIQLMAPGLIPWYSLKRLHIQGDTQIRLVLSTIIDKMTSLQSLRLHARSTAAFHHDCARSPANLLLTEPLPYTNLPNLHHLELHTVCPHHHISALTTPTLRSLSILLPEYTARLSHLSESRPVSELKYLAIHLPHLHTLSLQIGPLENLWHPTAIPGIDVSVTIYQALNTLSSIPGLHTLRLYPPYVPRSHGHDLSNARDPLADEQALRVFHHLRTRNPNITKLTIGATFFALRGFNPMGWTVRDLGHDSKTVLTTRQAGKDYELEQIWVGERRMTTRTIRHTFHRPYLRDDGVRREFRRDGDGGGVDDSGGAEATWVFGNDDSI